MIEWGLTPEQFNQIDYEVIHEIIEWRQAKAISQNTKNKAK